VPLWRQRLDEPADRRRSRCSPRSSVPVSAIRLADPSCLHQRLRQTAGQIVVEFFRAAMQSNRGIRGSPTRSTYSMMRWSACECRDCVSSGVNVSAIKAIVEASVRANPALSGRCARDWSFAPLSASTAAAGETRGAIRRASCSLVQYCVRSGGYRGLGSEQGRDGRRDIDPPGVVSNLNKPRRSAKPLLSRRGISVRLAGTLLWQALGNQIRSRSNDRPLGRLKPAGSIVTISNIVSSLGLFVPCADAGVPTHTPADSAPRLAYGRPRDAHTVNSCPSYTASDGNPSYHIVRQSKRRRRHAMYRCCNRQGEASNSDQP
jgi:hypothetical protein